MNQRAGFDVSSYVRYLHSHADHARHRPRPAGHRARPPHGFEIVDVTGYPTGTVIPRSAGSSRPATCDRNGSVSTSPRKKRGRSGATTKSPPPAPRAQGRARADALARRPPAARAEAGTMKRLPTALGLVASSLGWCPRWRPRRVGARVARGAARRRHTTTRPENPPCWPARPARSQTRFP
jgi:hypothetical protein